MKTKYDIRERLLLEVKQWFPRQCREQFEQFHCYYLPATKEHAAGFIICKDEPSNKEYRLVSAECMLRGGTIEQNVQRLYEICMKLPLLSQ